MANKNQKTNEKNQMDEGRVMTKYDRKLQRRQEEAIQRKKRKMAVRGTAIMVVAVCIIAAAFLIYAKVSESLSYFKVDGESISRSEFEFYYNKTLNTYASTYSAYGLDTTQPLEDQECLLDSSMSWKDYFEKMATEEIVEIKALVKDAEKNDFKADVDKEYEENVEALATIAKENNLSEKDYYKQAFGDSKEDIEDYMKEYILANLWYEEKSDSQEITDDEIEAYYQENKQDYDYVKYYVSAVTAEGVTVGTSSDAEITTAMALAKTKAQTQLNSIETSGTYEEYGLYADMELTLSEWLFADERTAGETAVLEDETSAVCYAVKFCEKNRVEKPTVDFYAIITSDEDVDGDKILKEWESGEKTEDSFIDMVEKYTENTAVEDGLFEGLTEEDVEHVEGLVQWFFEEERTAGDTFASVAEDGVKYIVYYKAANDPYYKVVIESELVSSKMQTYLTNLTSPIEVADPNGVLKYLEQAGEE